MPRPIASSRDERLKAALRSNMARRKAQGRARAAREEHPETGDTDEADTLDKAASEE